MTKLIMICKPYEIVIIPFPFSDKPGTKQRPVVVLSKTSYNSETEHTVFAMVTKAAITHWPGDIRIKDEDSAGVRDSFIRVKLASIDNRLIKRKIGNLGPEDCKKVKKALNSLFLL